MSGTSRLEALDASLRRRFRVVQTSIAIGGRALSILHPASAEDLIDEQDFERDERLPYWAELWPSSRVLAQSVLDMDGDGRPLLELGCGAGLVATCAALAGFRVVASDYYEDAPRFARVNAWRNGGRAIKGLLLDWRALPARLPRFDCVVASDVLYERPYGALVAQVIGRTLTRAGVAWVADPGRVGRESFLEALHENGLILRSQQVVPFAEGQIRQRIALYELGRAV
ncbi:MAG TPA: methyltransferase domain-containing protein [Gemmatimonadaceae bacterium]|nr:methyltransferase domain-containing protein [Gemmatimonadaceae bacterium]